MKPFPIRRGKTRRPVYIPYNQARLEPPRIPPTFVAAVHRLRKRPPLPWEVTGRLGTGSRSGGA
jgi:hypothetical protein